MKTAIYLRKSRADSDSESMEQTLRRHRETLLEFAGRQADINIVRVYEEVVSGDNLYSRPEMLKLLSDADGGLFESVLCIDIDRLGRGNMSDQGYIINTFKANSIKIITPRGVFDPNNDRDEDSLELETLKARWEYKSIKRRLRAGTIKSINEGCCLWEAPYGYKNVKVGKKSTLEINGDEAEFVKMIFDLYVNKGFGAQAIAYAVNSMGARTHRSDKFGRTAIVAILKNRVYTGKIVYNKKSTVHKGENGHKKQITIRHDEKDWTVTEGLHQAIVDEETFNRAGEILASRYHRPYNDGTVLNPLAGLLKCEKCGAVMQRRPYGTKKCRTEHLLCPTKGCCKSVRLDYAERAVIENISEQLKKIKVESASIGGFTDYSAVSHGIEKEQQTIKRQQNTLHDLLERGIYDVETFKARSETLKMKEDMLERQNADILEKQKAESRVVPALAKYENALALYNSSTPAGKNLLLKAIIRHGTYLKEKDWRPNRFVIKLELFDMRD